MFLENSIGSGVSKCTAIISGFSDNDSSVKAKGDYTLLHISV